MVTKVFYKRNRNGRLVRVEQKQQPSRQPLMDFLLSNEGDRILNESGNEIARCF